MAPATSQKHKGEGSGSKSTRAASRRRRRQDVPARSPTPSVTTRSKAAQFQPDSARGKRWAARAAGKEHPKKPQSARAAGRSTGHQDASGSGAAAQPASSSSASSAVSSPLRCPRLPKARGPDGTEMDYPSTESGIVSAYFQEKKKYQTKLDGKPLAWCSGFFVEWDGSCPFAQ